MTRACLLSVCLVASVAQATPLSASLSIPRLSLELLFGQTPPPVVLPDAPVTPPGPSAVPVPAPAPWTDGLDHLRLRDGRDLKGKILSQVQDGFLFSDAGSNTTFVVPFKDIADLQRASAPQGFTPTLAPNSSGERRFFLEAELRDLQTRLEAVSVWPGIEGIAGGVIGLGVGVVLLAVFGTSDGVELIFVALAGVTGLISLISGVVSLVSAENRKGELSGQIAQVQDQLSKLPPIAGLLPSAAPPALAFRF